MSKSKVLVMENELPVALRVTSLLTQAGFDVEVVTKGKRGLEIAQERKFDLIILATCLSDLSGLKICADLKQRHISYRTPIIFLSDQYSEEHREQALELGAADFIEKRFDAKDFISRIHSVVEETTLA